jgi:chromosome segregation ATPase
MIEFSAYRRAPHPVSIAVLMLALMLNAPARAQTTEAGPRENHSDWSNEKFERQEFREEMGQIRKEHEELEGARDKFQSQCANANGQQAAECDQQRQALHEWHDKLHDRTHALREKMEASHRARDSFSEGDLRNSLQGQGGKEWPQANNNMPQGPNAAPPPVPAPNK